MRIQISLLFLFCVFFSISALEAQEGVGKDSMDLSQLSFVELDSLIDYYSDKGYYKEVIPYVKQALEKANTEFSDIDSIHIWYTGVLALMYHEIGEYDEAEHLYLEAKQLTATILGKDHPLYTSWLNNLSSVNRLTGRYKEAEAISMEQLKIIKKTLGEFHQKYATALNNLANI